MLLLINFYSFAFIPSTIFKSDMRPTDLRFRSPKERTEANYISQITAQGHALFFKSLQHPKKTPSRQRKLGSFSKCDRFNDQTLQGKYQFAGPGSYNDSESFRKLNAKPCSATYRWPSIGREQLLQGDVYYVGNNLVKDPEMVSHRSRSREGTLSKSIENSG